MDKNKIILRTGLVLGIFGLIFGIYKFYQYQIRMALQYCYKLANITLLKISSDKISLKVFLKVQNKSSFTLNLSGYDLNIYVNSMLVANIKSVKEEIILHNAISELSIVVDFDPKAKFKIEDIAMIVLNFLTDKSKITISIKGNFHAKINFLSIKMPIEYKMSLKDIMATDSVSEAAKTKCEIK